MALRLRRRRQEPRAERQELHCHACSRYVQFTMDMSLNGNHVLNCPNCGHEHCRVVRNGVITEDRWDQRNGGPISVFAVTSSTTSTWTTFTMGSAGSGGGTTRAFLYQSWTNTGTGT